MARKRVPSPSCPEGHAVSQVDAYGTRKLKGGLFRRWRCTFPGADGEPARHFFSTREQHSGSRRDLLDEVVPRPSCPNPEHSKRNIYSHGAYDTLAGDRQRYRCVNPDDANDLHTFTATLPRSTVGDDTCCTDCEVPTPKHAGAEALTRRLNFPPWVVFEVLSDLASGKTYTHTSLRALERVGRSTGRKREVNGQTPEELNKRGLFGPHRDMKAHWHISADILERFAPVITEPVLSALREQIAADRAAGVPVVYFADEVPVRRKFGRTNNSERTSATVVWNALVVSRMKWEQDAQGNLVGRSSRLLRVRALPTATTEAWQLVFAELEVPDFLIADGAAAIRAGAKRAWGAEHQFVPCLWHAMSNITRRLTPKGGTLPEKVRDHMFVLSRQTLAEHGQDGVKQWFDDLTVLTDGAGLPADTTTAVRKQYEPLLETTAQVAQAHTNPEVPISNASIENQVATWVKRITEQRGAMFSNLARTNLLGDLVVAEANGALLNRHEVITALRDYTRAQGGWAPPPRALVEPAGTVGLRDPSVVPALIGELGL